MLTLLVADSNIQTCDELEQFCNGLEDIELIGCVHNGVETINIILSRKVDILLIDIVMPVLDGLGTLTRLQALEIDDPPFVFVHTAFLDNRLLQELQKLGVVYCFVKPMSPEHIIPRIMQLSRNSEYQNEAPPHKSLSAQAPSLAKTYTQDDINHEITKQIRDVGIPAHLRGYHYLRAAIQLSVEAVDPSTIAVTKDLYPQIAEQYKTRPALVERAIRNAIEVAWTRGNTKVLHEYFGYTIDDFKGKPTNAEFIAMIADRVRMVIKP